MSTIVTYGLSSLNLTEPQVWFMHSAETEISLSIVFIFQISFNQLQLQGRHSYFVHDFKLMLAVTEGHV